MWVDKYGPPTRTKYRMIVENLSTKMSWQVGDPSCGLFCEENSSFKVFLFFLSLLALTIFRLHLKHMQVTIAALAISSFKIANIFD